MALVVEDGSIVTGADSYVTRADYIAYALAVGVTISDTSAADVQLVKAALFIGSHEPRLIGARVARAQPMAYPREGVVLDGFEWDSTEIPRQVQLCQMAVALDINAGIDPYNPPANPSRAKKREKIDRAIEVEYFGSDAGAKMGRDSTSTALMSSLMRSAGLFLVRA